VLFASAVPDKTSLVIPVVASLTITGEAGAWVSTVTVKTFDTPLVWPATVSVAAKLLMPSASVPVKKLQAPLAFAVAVPSSVIPAKMLTVLFATAVPARVRIVASVIPSPTVPLSGENEIIAGTAMLLTARLLSPSEASIAETLEASTKFGIQILCNRRSGKID
jgi:hypothetical protein